MEQLTQLPELSRKIADWKGEVNEVREGLSEMQRLLEKIVSQPRQHDTLAKVEHFQNQFICQKEVADRLFHDLKGVAKRLGKDEQIHSDHPAAHDPLHDRMQTFRQLYTGLKVDFGNFSHSLSA